MRSWATRVENLNGPTQTGLVPNLSPSDVSAVGDMIMPARSARRAVSGAFGALRFSVTVDGSVTATLATLASSLLRAEVAKVMWRSRLVLTAAASIVVPSANLMPVRSLMVTVLPSPEMVGSAAASCGTMVSLASMS